MQQPVQIIATEAIIDNFIETCKTLDIRKVTIFLQSHINFFRVQTPAGYPHTTQDFILTLIRKCETFDISEEHKKRMIELIKASFNAFQQFHNILYSEWLNQEDQEGIDFHDVGYNYVVTDFVQSLNSIGFRSKCMLSEGEWHKPLVEYFLSTCQFDHAFAVSGLNEYRNLVLTTGEFLEKNSYGSPFCQCGVDHLSLIRSKLKTLEDTDSQLEEAATRGDKEQVNLLLVQGDPLRAIAGAIRQKNLRMIVDITNRYHFISNITIPILKQLADAKLDEMFCDYLELICNHTDYVGDKFEELIRYTSENGLVESTFSLIDKRVRQLSLPPIDRVYNYAGHYDSLFDNLPPKIPMHHRSVINATLQTAATYNQTHLIAALRQWQAEVESHYPNIEQLIIQDTDNAIEILNRYSIDYRHAFRAILLYSRMDLFEKLWTSYNLFLSKSNRMSLDHLFSFCGYLAFKFNREPAVRFLLKRVSNISEFAIDAIAAGNFRAFQALFRYMYDGDYKKAAYHFGKLGLSIFPILVNSTSKKAKSILKKTILGAIQGRRFDLLPDILTYCRQHELDSSNIFAVISEVAEYDLICILTLLSGNQDIETIVQCAIKNKSLEKGNAFKNQVARARKVMPFVGGDFMAAYACSDLGIRTWFLQRGGMTIISDDIYLIICSYLLGKDATKFQAAFFMKMQDMFLRMTPIFIERFLHRTYGEQNWEEKTTPEYTYYQQKPRSELRKKSRGEISYLKTLYPYDIRSNKRLFFRPPSTTKLEDRTSELTHKSRLKMSENEF